MNSIDSLHSLFSLRGHVGFVTGASSGLGVDCAVRSRWRAPTSRWPRAAAIAWRSSPTIWRATYGVRTCAIQPDITSDARFDAAIARAHSELGHVDILVNNAGISPTGRAETLPRATWDAAIATNLTAPMMLAQRVARGLIEAKRPGRIINIVSIYATVASSIYRLSAYTATKAGLPI